MPGSRNPARATVASGDPDAAQVRGPPHGAAVAAVVDVLVVLVVVLVVVVGVVDVGEPSSSPSATRRNAPKPSNARIAATRAATRARRRLVRARSTGSAPSP